MVEFTILHAQDLKDCKKRVILPTTCFQKKVVQSPSFVVFLSSNTYHELKEIQQSPKRDDSNK